ncbi:hypothetical protein GIX45_25775 [Erwinia sp. CPCC 100877]|nr:hypothetical protein [Erwinia sp. CPCC 100877]
MKTNQLRKRVSIVSLELVKEASTFYAARTCTNLKLSMSYSLCKNGYPRLNILTNLLEFFNKLLSK